MVGSGLDGLIGKMRQTRRQSISERGGHGIEKARVGARHARDALAGPPRKKLSGFRACRLVLIPVRAYLADGCWARFHKTVPSPSVGMHDNRPAPHRCRKQRAFESIR